jgi:ribonuclease D
MDTMTSTGTVAVRYGDITADDLDLIRSVRAVAWDIETSGLSWEQDTIGSCQVHVPNVVTLIVRVDGSVPDRLASALGDPDVVKVFHHAMFDLRFMSHAWKVRPSSVACTKIASKLLQPYADNTENKPAR